MTLNEMTKFAQDVKAEALRITWPSGKETRQMTIMVFILVGIVAAYLMAVDMGVGMLLKWLLGLSV
jgi:preprotein translocase subunit SecE